MGADVPEISSMLARLFVHSLTLDLWFLQLGPWPPLHGPSPTKECIYCSESEHLRDPKARGRNRGPLRDRSKRQIPLVLNFFKAATEAASSSGCIKIHAIPYAHQSVFKNNGLVESYRAKTGDDVTPNFKS